MSSALPATPVSTMVASPPRTRMYADTKPRLTRSQSNAAASPDGGGAVAGASVAVAPSVGAGRRRRGACGCRAGACGRRGPAASHANDRERERALSQVGQERAAGEETLAFHLRTSSFTGRCPKVGTVAWIPSSTTDRERRDGWPHTQPSPTVVRVRSTSSGGGTRRGRHDRTGQGINGEAEGEGEERPDGRIERPSPD